MLIVNESSQHINIPVVVIQGFIVIRDKCYLLLQCDS